MTILYDPGCTSGDEWGSLLGTAIRAVTTVDDLNSAVDADSTEQLVLVGPGAALSDALPFASRQRIARPALGIVLLREEIDAVAADEALRAGVRAVADAGDAAAVLDACFRSLALSTQLSGVPVANGAGPGRVVTVVAAKGGCGKTTIATNLAVALAADGARRVCLIDLDLSFGDVAIVLQLDPERTIADAVGLDRLDEASFYSLLTPYGRGLDTLLAPVGPTAGEQVGRGLVGEVLRIARRLYDYVVVDTPPFFTDPVIAALDQTDVFALLATPDIPALKNLRLTLDMFDLRGYSDDSRRIVLNGADARTGLSTADVEYVIRTQVHAEVPWSRDVPVSLNRGVPLSTEAPDHPVSLAIHDLAIECIVSGEQSTGHGRGRHWLLQRRRKAVTP